MGNSPSVVLGGTGDEINRLLALLNKRLELMQREIKKTRGDKDTQELRKKEIAGGRTAMQMSMVRVAKGTAVATEIGDAITNFFDSASSGVEGNSGQAKLSAVEGAKNLLLGGIDALFGARNGSASEQSGFVVLYMNNAFVRVDYYIYVYNASAKAWGEEITSQGACYIADLAVLKYSDLHPSEIDYFASQALAIPDGDFEQLAKIKLQFQQLRILNRMLERKDMTFQELEDVIDQVKACNISLEDAFGRVDADLNSVLLLKYEEEEALKKRREDEIVVEEGSKKKGVVV